MSETDRRKFLTVAGAGAVAAVGLSAAPAAAAAATRRTRGSATEPVVAHIANHDSSELRLLVGESEVVVQDRDLVTRILNAAGGKR